MGLELTLQTNLLDLDRRLSKLPNRVIATSVRQALNRTVTSVRATAARRLREERNLKIGDIKKQYSNIRKAKGSKLGSLQASIRFKAKSFNLARFITGKREPTIHTQPNPQRKALKFKVKPGKSKRKPGVFLIRGKNSNVIAVRRKGNKVIYRKGSIRYKGPIGRSEVVSGLHVLIERRDIRKPIEKAARDKLNVEFKRSYDNQIRKLEFSDFQFVNS